MYLVQICSQRGFYLQLLNISKFNSFPLSLKCLNLNYVECFHMNHLYYSLSYVARLYISTIDREILGLMYANIFYNL